MDDRDDVFDPELDDELERNWYRVARRSQQVERKLLVNLLECDDDPYEDVHRDLVVASRHPAYNLPGSPDDDEHEVRTGFATMGQGRHFEMDRYEALVWAISAFRTRERVAQGDRLPIVHFCALWPADAAFPWDASQPIPPGAGFGQAVEDVRSELRWMEPGSVATFVVTHAYLDGLRAVRLNAALWCITIPIPNHPVDPALIEELVRLGQWRGAEMARLDLRGGPEGSLQLLFRHHEVNEIASFIMLGARLLSEHEPDEYMVDVMIDELDFRWPDEAPEPDPTAPLPELAILQRPSSDSSATGDETSPAMVAWKTNMDHRAALRSDTRIDPRWHGFGDRFADVIRGLEETFGGGRWGTLAMTCYSAMHAFDGDASPHVRVSAMHGGWYCEVRDGTPDESRPHTAGLGIVPRGWGRGFAIAGDIHPDAHQDDTWDHGRLFPAGTSPFEVVHELLLVLTHGHGVLSGDIFAVDGEANWFAAARGMEPLMGSWVFRLAEATGPSRRETPQHSLTTAPEASEPQANEPEANEPEANEPEANEPEANEPEANDPKEALAATLPHVYEMQVDDSETAVFRCRADSPEHAVSSAIDAGFHDPLILAHAPIPPEEQTDRARAAAESDPLLGPGWMPLIDVLAAELDKIEIHRPRTVQTYGRRFQFDPRVSPYFQFLRQADGTMLAEVHGPWSDGASSMPNWEDRVRMLGWRLRGDEVSVTSEPLLREQADSPNPTKRFGAERSGYSIVSNVLSMVLFTWEITAEDLFALPGHPEVFDASPHLERVNNKSIFRILPPAER